MAAEELEEHLTWLSGEVRHTTDLTTDTVRSSGAALGLKMSRKSTRTSARRCTGDLVTQIEGQDIVLERTAGTRLVLYQ